MTLRLTCTKRQYENLYEDVDTGRSVRVDVNRKALQALLVDQVRLLKAAKRAVDVVEPGGNRERE